MAPETIPEHPMPEMDRPTMKHTDVGAIPDKNEPNSKMKRAHRNVHFTGKTLYTFPQNNWKAQLVRKLASLLVKYLRNLGGGELTTQTHTIQHLQAC